MTRLKSQEETVNQSPEEVYAFLSDFNNIGKLMPEQVENFSTDGESCSFTIKGMATLGLKYASKNPFSEIVMAGSGKLPFDFNLICNIQPAGNNQSLLSLMLDAELNAFMKMMAEKPLTNFLNLLVKKYQQLHSA